jgi:phage/plasmid-like protein (TIGR03299 family)
MPAEFDSGAFVRQPAWHQLGVVLDDYLSPEEMKIEAGLDWDVDLFPVYASYEDEDMKHHVVEVEDQYAVLRLDKYKPLGIVGSRYETIQNGEVFDFLEALMDDSEIQIETAGSLKDGRWVWAQAKIGDDITIDGDGHGQYLTVATSHDGSLAFTAYPTFVRIVCANTFSAAYSTKTVAYKVRHTQNAQMLVEEARRALDLVFHDGEKFAADVERLMNMTVTDKYYAELLDKLVPLPEEGEKSKAWNRRVTERAGISNLYFQSPTVLPYKNTAWGWVNAVNEWEQWGRGGTKKGETKPERAVRQFLAGKSQTMTSKSLALVGATRSTQA